MKTNIEKFGGTVELQSQMGLGTTVRIRIPLTLAILSVLMVEAGGERYAIPQSNVVELTRLREMEEKKQVDWVQGTAVCRLRGRLLPLVFLHTELQAKPPLSDAPSRQPSNEARTVIVLQAHDRQLGLVVDQVNDTEEIVVKPLGKLLKGTNTFAGATIMGNGRVALILDVAALARRVSVISTGAADNQTMAEPVQDASESELGKLLLFEGPAKQRVAIPLSRVMRLEELPSSAIEMAGVQEVMQYRNEVLPLIRISELLANGARWERVEPGQEGPTENIKVLVCRQNDCSFGLVVDHVLDIVEHKFTRHRSPDLSKGYTSEVIQGRITTILDLESSFKSLALPTSLAVELEA